MKGPETWLIICAGRQSFQRRAMQETEKKVEGSCLLGICGFAKQNSAEMR